MHKIVKINTVEIIAPYTLRLRFNDGSVRTIDLETMLYGELFGPLRDLSLFNQCTLDKETGTIVWPNGADFDPATLYDWDKNKEELYQRAQQWKTSV